MKSIFFALFSLLMIAMTVNGYADKPDWTIAIYAAIDEEDLDHHAGAVVRNIENLPLPENVELLFQSDDSASKSVLRYAKRGDKILFKKKLSEHNSASARSLRNYIKWVKEASTGNFLLLNIATHSWGWKGIIQDFTIPNKPGSDSMMSLVRFRGVIEESGLKIDILMLDCCILGNVEPLAEFWSLAPYIVLSERETPYSGFPLHTLFDRLKDQKFEPRELARIIPGIYAKAYSRKGDMARVEGEYDVITAATIDTLKWKYFVQNFKRFTEILKTNGFRKKLKNESEWFDRIADVDLNVDIVEFLKRVSLFMNGNSKVLAASNALLKQINYPDDISNESSYGILVDQSKVKKLRLTIQGDEFLNKKEARENLYTKFASMNQDLAMDDFDLSIIEKSKNDRIVIVEVDIDTRKMIRPWLPGAQFVVLEYMNKDGSWSAPVRYSRERDYFIADDFGPKSFMLSEAHTQGAPFIHGIGICLKPLMDDNETAGIDPENPQITGPSYYAKTAWNKETGWGDLMLLNLKE